MQEITTKPLLSIFIILSLWQILNLIFIRWIKLPDLAWIRLEYVWIILGLSGVITLVIENSNKFKLNEIGYIENYIKSDFNFLFEFVDKETECFQFNYNSLMPKAEFEQKQAESDSICKWVKKVIKPLLLESKKSEYAIITDYKKPQLHFRKNDYTVIRIERDILKINDLIDKRNELRVGLYTKNKNQFLNSIGIISLMVGFALRLTLVTKKVANKKNN